VPVHTQLNQTFSIKRVVKGEKSKGRKEEQEYEHGYKDKEDDDG
jgi:hypothetical protein